MRRHFSSRWPVKPATAGTVALLCGVIVAGAVSASGRAAGAAPASAASSPPTVTATRIPADKPPFRTAGTIVRSSQLGVRVFIGSEKGFALSGVGQAQYPAATVDGGKTWRIDGPHLHVNAANAPNVVNAVGAVGPATYFAYGGPGGGMSVAVTTDGGKDWWRAYLPGVPLAVLYSRSDRALVALVESGPLVKTGPPQFWAYLSTDGGKHWTYDKNTFL